MSTKKLLIEGRQWINGHESGQFRYDFEYEISDNDELKSNELSKLIVQPWRLFFDGKKLGVKGLTRFILLIILFTSVNLYFVIECLHEAVFNSNVKTHSLLMFGLCLLIGLIVFIAVVYLSYRYLVVEVLSVLYSHNSGFFRSLSTMMVERAHEVISGNSNIQEDDLRKAIDFGELISGKLSQLPYMLRKMVKYVVKRLPLMDSINTLQNELKNGNKASVSENFYLRMDNFIRESVFESNNTNWAFLLLPLNLLAQILVFSNIN